VTDTPPQTDFVLVLDQVRDPGNLGTILRSAAAAGVRWSFYRRGARCVRTQSDARGNGGPFSPFHSLCWLAGNLEDIAGRSANPRLKILLAESGDGEACWQTDLRRPLALIIGGEAEGAGLEARLAMDGLIHIPMPGQFESLNAAVATGILLFEVVRQRSQP